MSVLFAAGVVPAADARTGGGRVMYGELRAIARRHEVVLVTCAVRGRDEESLAALARTGMDMHVAWVGVSPGQRVARGLRWIGGPLPIGALEPTGSVAAALRSAARRRPDILHVAASRWASAFLLDAGRQHRGPSILTEHEPGPPDPPIRAGAAWGARAVERMDARRWRPYLRGAYHRFDAIQVFTREDAGALARHDAALADRITVNPFGVEIPDRSVECGSHAGGLDGAAMGSPAEADRLLFVGNRVHPPNADAVAWLVRDIFPLVRRARPTAELLLAGPGPAGGPDATGVRTLGDVADLGSLYQRAAVVVAPVRSGTGMRQKVVEAMAHGCAVVTTTLGAAGLEVDGVLPPLRVADTTGQIAAAAADLLANPVQRAALGSAARDHVRAHLTWSAYERRLADVYDAAERSWRERKR